MAQLRIVIGNQYDPYLNLAAESILTDEVLHDTITLFLWKNQKTVVIGINQNPYSECNVSTLLEDNGHLARRRTGGGAVFHDLGNLNFSFIADKKTYDVNKQLSVIQGALRQFGLETQISGRNDLTFEGRKFSGNAFYNGKEQNLHHGTILIKTDSQSMQKYLVVNQAKLQKNGVKSVASRVINLSEAADITSDNIIPALISSFEEIYQNKAQSIDFDTICQQDKVQELRSRIASDDYLFGKWKSFSAEKKAQFTWGGVEISLDIDESNSIIRDVKIASDCLQLTAIESVKSLLTGASTKQRPTFKQDNDAVIINDILDLIY